MSGTELERLLSFVGDAFPEWTASVDEPGVASGRWFVDLRHPIGRHVVVEWRPGGGFGLSVHEPGRDVGYGERPDEHLPTVGAAEARLRELLR